MPGGVFQIIGLVALLAVGGELCVALAVRSGRPSPISRADSDVERLRQAGAL